MGLVQGPKDCGQDETSPILTTVLGSPLAGATRLTGSDFRLNLLLLKGQRCVWALLISKNILPPFLF